MTLLPQLLMQATLWLSLGLLLVSLARRRGPRAAAETSVWVLSGLALLTLLALVPWPAWFPLPEWQRPGPPEVVEMLPPPAPLPSPSKIKESAWKIETPALAAEAAPAPVASTPTPLLAPEVETPGWLLAGAWLAAALASLCLARLGLALLAVRRCRRCSQPVTDAGLRRLCDELRQVLGVSQEVELRELAGLGSPATMGWRRPVILLPEDWPTWNEAERRAVLAHELAHIRRGDYGRWLLTLCCAAIHGYHPLAHWLLRGLRRDQELAADALAAGPAGGIQVYAQALCRLALRRDGGKRLGLARAFLPVQVSLTRRVEKMLRNKREEVAVSTKGRLAVGLLMLATCMAVAGMRCPAEAEESRKPGLADNPGKLVQKTYSVADLVIPIDNYVVPPVADLGPPRAEPKRPSPSQEDRLIKLIQETIAPQTWAANGGPASIEYFALGMALVINQTPDVHQQINDLFSALRQLQDLEISVEMRMVSVSAAMAKQLKREFGIDCGMGRKNDEPPAAPQVVHLDDKKLFALMESLQGDRKANVMQAPKVTLFNGQQASIQIQDFQWFVTEVQTVEAAGQVVFVPKSQAIPMGWSFGVQATAAGDRHAVRVGLDMEMNRLAAGKVPLHPVKTLITPVSEDGKEGKPEPFTQYIQQPSFQRWRVKHTVNVAEGGTAVLSGWKMRQDPIDLKKEAEDAYLLVTVTPRIIIRSEQEEIQTGVNTRALQMPQPAPNQEVRDLLARYEEACRQGNLEAARQLAAQALRLDPTCFISR